MQTKYEVRDLFTAPQGYYLAHCISGDCSLGAGVAKQMDIAFDLKAKLQRESSTGWLQTGKCYLIATVFSLVDKETRRDSADYGYLEDALYDMKEIALAKGIKKIAIPKLGCGMDKLDWAEVYDYIVQVFADTDIEFLICVLSEDEIPETTPPDDSDDDFLCHTDCGDDDFDEDEDEDVEDGEDPEDINEQEYNFAVSKKALIVEASDVKIVHLDGSIYDIIKIKKSVFDSYVSNCTVDILIITNYGDAITTTSTYKMFRENKDWIYFTYVGPTKR